ncbi:MAG: sigma-70 family RNA polymerase sigma factor, partial [Candidatus Poribacteria bacterium]|nr:sigma-70 family RNA polymerase sigma factor [Candidatus Poribacteria bacterium]
MPSDYEDHSDAQLVQCYQKGNGAAGNVLCQRYWIVLYRFFKKKIRGSRKEDIEDLVQETFMQALQTLPDLQAPASFRAWLNRIARRVLRDWIDIQKKRSIYTSPAGATRNEPEQRAFIETRTHPDSETLDHELGDIRLHFEETLGPKYLEVFHLRNQSNKSFKEIGAELGIKTGT